MNDPISPPIKAITPEEWAEWYTATRANRYNPSRPHPDPQSIADALDHTGSLLIARLVAAVEALKCCGNCNLWRPEPDADDRYVCKSIGVTFEPPGPGSRCHFTPSRWTPYWDAEQKAGKDGGT